MNTIIMESHFDRASGTAFVIEVNEIDQNGINLDRVVIDRFTCEVIEE